MRISRAVRFLLLACVMLSMSSALFGQIGVAISFAPPALPVYEQPLCPGDGYLWTPGYWAWDADYDDYYWVPGTWVMAPEVGFLWTPPYWGWGDGGFVFYDGYWGPTVGFYGGINYGFGYFGAGFEGGRWDNGHFFYNRAVMNVNVTNIHNVYESRVENVTVNHVSYNGGNGGTTARPTPQQEAAAHERHLPPVAAQTQHVQEARSNPELRASTNHGKPPIAATARPGDFKGEGVIHAKEAGAPYHAPAKGGAPEENAARGEGNAARGNEAGRTAEDTNRGEKAAVHPKDLPAVERPAAPNTGNAKQDKKYQKQQEKLVKQQNKERQKLQAQQDKEHQQMAKQQANEAKQQQMEQRHQQQTQQLQQRHTEQMQHLQQRQQPARSAAPRPPERKP